MDFLTFNLVTFAETLGYFGLFVIIFAESGFFFGFFLPGDSLLFSAGLLATQGIFNPFFLFFLLAFAAVLGDTTGFWFGAKVGPKIFSREDSRFFHKKHIDHAKKFYEKYGPRAIVLARFVPIVRTFAPIIAGVGKMQYKKFLSYNVVGGILWVALLVFSAYFLGSVIPGVQKYISYIALFVITLSFLPVFFELRKNKKQNP